MLQSCIFNALIRIITLILSYSYFQDSSGTIQEANNSKTGTFRGTDIGETNALCLSLSLVYH